MRKNLPYQQATPVCERYFITERFEQTWIMKEQSLRPIFLAIISWILNQIQSNFYAGRQHIQRILQRVSFNNHFFMYNERSLTQVHTQTFTLKCSTYSIFQYDLHSHEHFIFFHSAKINLFLIILELIFYAGTQHIKENSILSFFWNSSISFSSHSHSFELQLPRNF